MKILAIETSCDESSLAILEVNDDIPSPRFSVLSHLVASQAAIHAEYGGVFPAVAKREHAKALVPLLEKSLDESKLLKNRQTKSEMNSENLEQLLEREPELLSQLSEFFPTYEKPDLDYICVTVGPGLEPALWVGINFAKALALIWDIPVIPVNHMAGHIWSVFAQGKEFSIPKLQFPMLALLISGGHTEFVLVKDFDQYQVVGKTRDDAVGEAYDKVARLLDLPYPGGPHIEKLAAEISEQNTFSFPRPMMHTDDLDFSFSGLKTAVRYAIQNKELTDQDKQSAAKEFQDAVTEVLVKKTKKALEQFAPSALTVAGGVAANEHIKNALSEVATEFSIPYLTPGREVVGDNALMIGVAGAIKIMAKTNSPGLDDLRAVGNMQLS